ncbi:glycosyltransferase family 4 protein [Candidatus Gottesmanbacteria bacterium]|nr:glycosyltransferase family 4 protein [Candidatus Gottesmanbacteria bacterium]
MKKTKVAIVRGAFLNAYEMQSFEPLIGRYDLTAFGTHTSFQSNFKFPTKTLFSPMDLSCGAGSRFARPILNRLFVDAHCLFGLKNALSGFDIVHTAETYYRYTQQALDAKKEGKVKKVIATVLENIPHNNEGIWGRKEYKKRSREELDHIIALTHKTKDALILEGADERKITVIGHGVDVSRFSPHQRNMQSNMPLVVLFSGRLEYTKGIDDVLAVVRLFASDNKVRNCVKFQIVGDGSLSFAVDQTIRELPVGFLERKPQVEYNDMQGIYREADIVIAPSKPTKSWDEQYCTVLLEAQAMGLPIVTTNTGGIPENVGDAAILVKPGNTRGLFEGVRKFVDSKVLRSIYGEKARKRALAIHDARVISDKIAGLYEKILSS